MVKVATPLFSLLRFFFLLAALRVALLFHFPLLVSMSHSIWIFLWEPRVISVLRVLISLVFGSSNYSNHIFLFLFGFSSNCTSSFSLPSLLIFCFVDSTTPLSLISFFVVACFCTLYFLLDSSFVYLHYFL